MEERSLSEAEASASSRMATLETLQVEASCPVCLDYLQEPVITHCGHTFCKACITRSWKDLESHFPCPVCRKTSRHRSLRPNWQLGGMVEVAKQLKRGVKRKVREESRLCPQHHQLICLFCHKDQEALCVLCSISHIRQDHRVVPLDQAAQDCQERLHECLEALEQKMRDVARSRSSEERKPRELRRLVQRRREQILQEFEELHRRLEQDERCLLSRLQDEEQELLGSLRVSAARLGDQQQALSHMAAEVEDRSQQSGLEMLKDVQSALKKCEELTTMEVAPVPIELTTTFGSFPRQYFVLRKILQELSANVTLDPETAHANLVVSEDRKSVKCVETRRPNVPEKTPWRSNACPCVLATEGFSSGRHYWEVEVGDKTHWDIGVCQKPESQKGELTQSPGNGFWRLRLWNGDSYAATTSPFTPLVVKVKPKRVGVFLDYEAGTLSFYNVTDRSHLYTFTDTFTEKLWPCFYPGIWEGRKNAAPLSIRTPTDWE
uniref:E3 ubiquitin-protein ligase TRIM39-like isoform X1 n=1 Tax=Jaculus jaculus TaxID=51337 RepID=UPI001E1B33AF|nr:E3 ubiquitin-protein ligase TRIM39-like isoform X1 [Jaculus jaculus]